jgi:hypothetical protein
VSKQFEHLQESSVRRLRDRIPSGVPLLVSRHRVGFRAFTLDERTDLSGRFQVVAAFIDGFVAAWTRRGGERTDSPERTDKPANF